MSDILLAMPWQCGDNDCTVPGTWHKGTYWIDDEDGYTYDEFSDGDHEVIDEAELPTPEDEVRMWALYRLWAVDNQLDPLDEFMRGVPARDSEDAQAIRDSGELR